MAFAFKLSLEVSSSAASAQGAPVMTDWIKREVERLKDDETAKQHELERTKLIEAQAPGFWSDFRYLIEEAVAKLNNTLEIRRNIGEVRFNGNNDQILRVENIVFPAVYLTITNEWSGIRIERVVRTNGGIPVPREMRESERLQFEMDESGRVALKTEGNEFLSVHDAVEYVLKPLVRKHES
jgi:hypothetical protein